MILVLDYGGSEGTDGVFKLTANTMTDGKAIDINVNALTTGTAIEVVGNNALIGGKLLHLKTTSGNALNPVVITADSVDTGTIMRIDAAGITTGNGLSIEGPSSSSSTMTSGALLKLTTSAQVPVNGVMQVEANSVTTGKVLNLAGAAVDAGTILNLDGNTALTFGNLLNVATLSATAQHPIALTANNMRGGNAIAISTTGLTTGSALEITTNAGTAMKDPQTPKGSVDISASGVFTVSDGNTIDLFDEYDHVILASCTTSGNNGNYVVGSKGGSTITLLNMDGSAVSGLTINDDASCTIQHAGSRLLNIVATAQTAGKIIDLNIDSMATGTGIEIIGNTALTSGKLLHLETTSASATNPVVITADSVNTGTIMQIDADGITDGNGLLIEGGSGTTLNNGALLKVSATSTTPVNGLMQVEGNSVTTGTVAKISANVLTDGKAFTISSSSNALTNTGSLASLVANSATAGTIVDVSATSLQSGVGLKITTTGLTTGDALQISSGNGMTSGSLIALTTGIDGGSEGTDGVFKLTANTMTVGKAIDINVNALTTGTAIEVIGNSALIGGKLLHLETTSASATNPVVITADSVNTGTIMQIDADGITDGNGLLIEGGSGTTLNNGALLKVSATSTTPVNGLMQVEGNSVTTGTVAKISANVLTDGKAFTISSSSNALTNTGSLASLVANSATAGTIVDVSATSLQSGVGLKITTTGLTTGDALQISSGNGMTSGSLIALTTGIDGGSEGTDGVFKLDATSMTIGKAIDVNIDSLSSGTAIEVIGNTALSTGKLLHLETTSAAADNPVVVTANSVATGTIMQIDATGITEGNGLSIVGPSSSSTTMTSGALLKLVTSTQTPSGGVMQIEANTVQSGKVVEISAAAVTSATLLNIIGGSSQSSGSLVKITGLAGQKALQVAAGNMDVSGYVEIGGGMQITATSITTLGSSISDAAAMNALDSIVSIATTGDDMGIKLPSAALGMSVKFIRVAADHRYIIYPASGSDTVNTLSSYIVKTTDAITSCTAVSTSGWACSTQSSGGGSVITTLGVSDDVTLSKNAAQITHTGSTSLTVSSSSANVFIEGVEFNGDSVDVKTGTLSFGIAAGTSNIDMSTDVTATILVADNQNAALIFGSSGLGNLMKLKTTTNNQAVVVTGTTTAVSLHVDVGTALFDETVTIQGDSVTLGGNNAFTLQNPSHSSGAGTKFSIIGQTAGGSGDAAGGDVEIKGGTGGTTNGNGGDVILRAGALAGGGLDGNVKIQSGSGGDILDIASDGTVTLDGKLVFSAESNTNLDFSSDSTFITNLANNQASAFVIKSSGTNAAFFTIDTTTDNEKVKLTGASSGKDVFHVGVGTALFDDGIKTAIISYTDGDTAMTIADTGLVTFPQIVSMSSTLTIAGASMTVGGNSAFSFGRPEHGSGAGTATSIVGQAGASGGGNFNGGNVVLKPGVKGGSGIDGNIKFQNAAGNVDIVDITSAGVVSVTGSLIVDSVNIDGAVIGHTADPDLITLADGTVTFTGTTVIPDVDINGGAIDAAVIGANSPSAGTFTTLNLKGDSATVGGDSNTFVLKRTDRTSSGAGAAFTIVGQAGNSGTNNGGAVSVTGGDGVSTGNGGSLTLQGGGSPGAGSGGDVILIGGTHSSGTAGGIKLKSTVTIGDGGTEFTITEANDVTFKNTVSDGDIIFNVNDGSTDTTVMTLDGATASVLIGSGKLIYANTPVQLQVLN